MPEGRVVQIDDQLPSGRCWCLVARIASHRSARRPGPYEDHLHSQTSFGSAGGFTNVDSDTTRHTALTDLEVDDAARAFGIAVRRVQACPDIRERANADHPGAVHAEVEVVFPEAWVFDVNSVDPCDVEWTSLIPVPRLTAFLDGAATDPPHDRAPTFEEPVVAIARGLAALALPAVAPLLVASRPWDLVEDIRGDGRRDITLRDLDASRCMRDRVLTGDPVERRRHRFGCRSGSSALGRGSCRSRRAGRCSRSTRSRSRLREAVPDLAGAALEDRWEILAALAEILVRLDLVQ